MVTIGNDALPGTITTIESAATAGANVDAPGTPVVCGQAYLSDGSASADTVYEVTRPNRARTLFGPPDKSMLTQVIQDAIVEGAYPVYAVAAPETDQTDDLSGTSSDTGTLSASPIVEVASDITFTINSTTKTTVLYRDGDPANGTPGTDEVLLNPQTGKWHADETAGNTGDEATYTSVDYANTFDAITDAVINDVYIREVVDFIAPVDEKQSVVTAAKDKAESMESNGWFAIAVGGAGEPYIDDTGTGTNEISNYTNPYDTSRAMLLHPTRKGGGDESVLGAYLGVRARLGINQVSMYSPIESVTTLQYNLSDDDQVDLDNANVTPLEERRSAVRIVEDLTTVSDSNDAEAAWERSFARLVTDFVVESVDETANDYIGEFNDRQTLNTIRGILSDYLTGLLTSRSIEAYSLIVEEVDSTTAAIDVGINTADPLRNIELTISAGNVQNGVSVEAE